jgi:hypothetical protein
MNIRISKNLKLPNRWKSCKIDVQIFVTSLSELILQVVFVLATILEVGPTRILATGRSGELESKPLGLKLVIQDIDLIIALITFSVSKSCLLTCFVIVSCDNGPLLPDSSLETT